MSNELIAQNSSLILKTNDELGFFRETISERKVEADAIIEKASDAILAVGKLQEYVKTKDDFELVLDLSPEVKKAIKEGKTILDKNAAGEMFAQIRDKSGKLSKKIPIKELPAEIPVDPIALSTALQMKAIEKKLDNIVDALDEIGADIERVLEGQQNDRIGLYLSGVSLYNDALLIEDDVLRKMVITQALKSLSDSASQESQCIIADVEYLMDGQHVSGKRKNALEQIDDRLSSISKCFEIVHKAMAFRAGIYYQQGEMNAMLKVFDEYGAFIQSVFVPNEKKLAEMDSHEKYLRDTKWSKKANVLTDIDDLKGYLVGQVDTKLLAGGQENVKKG